MKEQVCSVNTQSIGKFGTSASYRQFSSVSPVHQHTSRPLNSKRIPPNNLIRGFLSLQQRGALSTEPQLPSKATSNTQFSEVIHSLPAWAVPFEQSTQWRLFHLGYDSIALGFLGWQLRHQS
jgi:hypothetical protein